MAFIINKRDTMNYFRRTVRPWIVFVAIGLCVAWTNQVHAEEGEAQEVARVYDLLIFPEDIAPQSVMADRQRSNLSEEEYKKWEKDYQIKMVEQLIYSALKERLLKEMDMEPTEAEIQSFSDFLKKSQAAHLEEFRSRREEVLKKLQSSDLSEAQRTGQEDHLKTLDNLIEQEIKLKEEEKLIPNYEDVKRQSLNRVAAVMVTNWKFNKALYEKYGGRIIFQQAGLEPIDACKEFLNEHIKDETYKILDSQYDSVFDRFYEYFEMGHTYLDKKDGDQYFDKPWWETAGEEIQ